MILTEDELRNLITPMITTAILETPPSATSVQQITDALLEVFRQDRRLLTERAPETTSDGYHTFKELYQFRMLYNAAWFNTLAEWQEAEGDQGYKLFKSWRHSNGELPFGGGWFVTGAELPTGQITNHYEAQHWDLFAVPEVAQAPVWDGHTAAMVAERLEEFLRGNRHD